MGELRTTVETDKWAAEYREVNENFGTLFIAWGFRWGNPVIGERTVGEDACVEVCSFAGTSIEPEACCEIHASSLKEDLCANERGIRHRLGSNYP